MPTKAGGWFSLESPFDEADDLLRRFIAARETDSLSHYLKGVADNRISERDKLTLLLGLGTRLCVCTLSHGGVARDIPNTTQQECYVAGSTFGLDWKWQCASEDSIS